jgi:hypothetical protein
MSNGINIVGGVKLTISRRGPFGHRLVVLREDRLDLRLPTVQLLEVISVLQVLGDVGVHVQLMDEARERALKEALVLMHLYRGKSASCQGSVKCTHC